MGGFPHNKDYGILGSILGSPYFAKLPYIGSALGVCPERMGLICVMSWMDRVDLLHALLP